MMLDTIVYHDLHMIAKWYMDATVERNGFAPFLPLNMDVYFCAIVEDCPMRVNDQEADQLREIINRVLPLMLAAEFEVSR